MFKLVSSIGNAAYKTAAKTGLAAGLELPPYPCALPLREIDDGHDVEVVEAILDDVYTAVLDLMSDTIPILNSSLSEEKLRRPWKSVDFKDKGGDIELYTRPHVGPYNFAQATFSLDGVSPAMILSHMHAQDLQERNRFSNSLCQYEVLLRNPAIPAELRDEKNEHLPELQKRGLRDWHIEYNRYYTPPPVTPRDFIYLIEKRYDPATQSTYIYGCSVDYKDLQGFKMQPGKCIRGAVLFGWRLRTDGDRTRLKYVSCMNPNGWTPTFIMGWLKAEVAKEFQGSRKLLYELIGGQPTATTTASAAARAVHGGSARLRDSFACYHAKEAVSEGVQSENRDEMTSATDGSNMDVEDKRLYFDEELMAFDDD